MKDWLERYIKAIVKHPEHVSLAESDGLLTHVYELSVHPDDVGMVKGRRKRLLLAICNILVMRSGSEQTRHVLKIVG